MDNINIKINHYPDGQQDVNILDPQKIHDYDIIEIVSRFNSFKDLEVILSVHNVLKTEKFEGKIRLYIPYLLGARSDRKFVEGGTNYLVDVLAPIINSMNLDQVSVYDVHSDVAQACIKNLVDVNKDMLLMMVLGDVYGGSDDGDYMLVAPDAGASKKIFNSAKAVDSKGGILFANKERDLKTNAIVRTQIPQHKIASKYFILDDLCDGGYTFINLAQAINDYCIQEGIIPELYLVVNHGVFSKGYTELNKYFKGIYCTNSYQDIGDVTGNNSERTNVKQLIVL